MITSRLSLPWLRVLAKVSQSAEPQLSSGLFPILGVRLATKMGVRGYAAPAGTPVLRYLEGRTAMVTGGASGMGRAMALLSEAH